MTVSSRQRRGETGERRFDRPFHLEPSHQGPSAGEARRRHPPSIRTIEASSVPVVRREAREAGADLRSSETTLFTFAARGRRLDRDLQRGPCGDPPQIAIDPRSRLHSAAVWFRLAVDECGLSRRVRPHAFSHPLAGSIGRVRCGPA